MAGSLSGVHRKQVDKPHPFKPDEEKKHGGKIHGKHEHHKLGRKRGGHVKKKSDGIIGQDGKSSEHGTGDTPDRGLRYSSHTQGVPMADNKSGNRFGFKSGKESRIEDSLKDGGKVKWLQNAINPAHKGMEQRAAKKAGLSTHEFMEKHKHDSGKSGARARLGLRLSAMAKHKD